MVELLRASGDLLGEPKAITHPVKFYEKGDRPLEIVSTRQWYIVQRRARRGAAERLIDRGREIDWHPDFMRVRYENWVGGLSGDWLISRQRFFGVPIPVWYPLDADGNPVFDEPIVATRDLLPGRPVVGAGAGLRRGQRGEPGGFIGEHDIMDTWATSSLTPQLAAGWERDPELFDLVFPYSPAPAGAGHHPHLAVLDRAARRARARRSPVGERRDLGLHRRPRPQEDVEVEGQRRHARRACSSSTAPTRCATGRHPRASAPTPRSTRRTRRR